MPTVINAIITNAALDNILQSWANTATFNDIDTFKVGEGGYVVTAAGQVPRDPTEGGPTSARGPFLTDLDAIQNPADYPTETGTFQKALNPGDFSYNSATKVLSVTCLLDFGEFNDDGFGNSPEIYEIGLFAGSLLVAYGTMTQQVKTVGVQIPNIVRVTATGT